MSINFAVVLQLDRLHTMGDEVVGYGGKRHMGILGFILFQESCQ